MLSSELICKLTEVAPTEWVAVMDRYGECLSLLFC